MTPGPSLLLRASLIATVSRRPFPRAPVRRVRLGNGGGAFAPWKTARGGRKAPNTVSHSAKAPHVFLGGAIAPCRPARSRDRLPFFASLMRSSFVPVPAVARADPRIAQRNAPVPTLGARAPDAVGNRVRASQESPCGFPWRGRARGVALEYVTAAR